MKNLFALLLSSLLILLAGTAIAEQSASFATATEGPNSAKIKIMMFLNPAGEDSARHWKEIRNPLVQRYMKHEKIQVIYFDVPTDAYGMEASLFLHCAPSHTYTNLLSELLAKQRLWRTGTQLSYLQYLASKNGLAWEPLQKCMDDPVMKAKLEQNISIAKSYYGLHSKPEYIVLGTPYRFSRRATLPNIAAVIEAYTAK